MVVTILSMLACFLMRGLLLPDKPQPIGIVDLFRGLLALVDGFALGMTVCLLGIRLVAAGIESQRDLKHWLEYAAGMFSLYALIIGVPLLVFQLPNLNVFDACLYPFIFLSNYSLVRRMLRSPGWGDDKLLDD